MLFKAKDFHDLSLDLMEALNCSRSLALAICVRHKSLHENGHLLSVESHLLYDTPHKYYLAAQSCAVFKKRLWDLPEETIDKVSLSESALEAFLKVEHECAVANTFLRARVDFNTNGLLHRAAIIAQSILGCFNDNIFSTLEPRYTSGSSATLSGLDTNIESKILSPLSVSRHAAGYILTATQSSRLLKDLWCNLEYVDYNVFRTVPKQFDKERIVCPEPVGNMLLQRHIARSIRSKLRKVGINIKSQADVHKSILTTHSDLVATIDQSDASDRISFELVKQVLPPDWFYVLNQIRSKKCLLPDGRIHELQKFMTQGNGFTFELETLIFYCIVKASLDNNHSCEPHFVSIFGDDTLVYDWHSETAIRALKLCFLKINTQKSYSKSTFKESCGTDIMENQNVRPIYFKEFSRGIFGLYELANRVYEVSRFSSNNIYSDRRFIRAYNRVISRVPINKRYYGPASLGDSVLTDLSGENWNSFNKNGQSYVWYLSPKPHKIGKWKRVIRDRYGVQAAPFTGTAQIVYALLGYSSQGTLIRGAPRRATRGKCNIIERCTGPGWL